MLQSTLLACFLTFLITLLATLVLLVYAPNPLSGINGGERCVGVQVRTSSDNVRQLADGITKFIDVAVDQMCPVKDTTKTAIDRFFDSLPQDPVPFACDTATAEAVRYFKASLKLPAGEEKTKLVESFTSLMKVLMAAVCSDNEPDLTKLRNLVHAIIESVC